MLEPKISSSNAETPPMAALKYQQEVQKLFDKAWDLKIQAYNWIPPEWKDDLQLEDNSADEGVFNDFASYGNPKNPAQQSIREDRRKTEVESDRKASVLKKWPKYSFDTTHEDGDGNEFPEDSRQMKRLGLIYEWAVLRAITTLTDINNVFLEKPLLEKGFEGITGKQQKYNAARTNYITFLQDLEDSEPERSEEQEPLDPSLNTPLDANNPKKSGRKSGYGRSLKSVYIAPVIFNHLITGMRIIVVWNPHSSSMGVPIKT